MEWSEAFASGHSAKARIVPIAISKRGGHEHGSIQTNW